MNGVLSPVNLRTSNPRVRGLPSGPVPYFICTSESRYRGFDVEDNDDETVVSSAAHAGSEAVTKVDDAAVNTVAARRNWALLEMAVLWDAVIFMLEDKDSAMTALVAHLINKRDLAMEFIVCIR